MFAEDFAKSGHGLSRVELQRVKSSLHCAASSAADTPQVAVLAFGPEIHCFVVQKPGLKDADASQIEFDISQSMEQHMKILCDNKLFPTGAYISQIHPVENVPVGVNGTFIFKELQCVVRNSTSTEPLKSDWRGPIGTVTPILPSSPSTVLKPEFGESEPDLSKRLRWQSFLYRIRSKLSGLARWLRNY